MWQNQVDDLETTVGLRNVTMVGGPTGGDTQGKRSISPSFLLTDFNGVGHAG